MAFIYCRFYHIGHLIAEHHSVIAVLPYSAANARPVWRDIAVGVIVGGDVVHHQVCGTFRHLEELIADNTPQRRITTVEAGDYLGLGLVICLTCGV